MKNVVSKVVGALALLVVFSVGNVSNAQTTDSVIPEVTIKNGDGFHKLRNLIGNNFDYANPQFGEGTFKSMVEFDLTEDGKVTNVKAKGDCKHVSAELVNTISTLLYKVDTSKMSEVDLMTHYKMPIVVQIAKN